MSSQLTNTSQINMQESELRHAGRGPTAGSTRSKKETRVALIKVFEPRGPVIMFILRGVKGLEKVFVLHDKNEVDNVLKQFSAIPLEVDHSDPADMEKIPKHLRGAVVSYIKLMERLSSELNPLLS